MKTRTLVSILILVLVVLIISNCETTSKMLIRSAESGDYAEVIKLIEQGADVNEHGWDGYTALMVASYKGHTEVARLLIEQGVDVNAQDKRGRTALEWASRYRHKEIVKLLKEAGAKE